MSMDFGQQTELKTFKLLAFFFNFCGCFYTKPVVIILHQMRESEVSTSPVVSLEADGHLWNTVSGLKANFFGLGVQTTKKMNI